jgi:hypothetical protein
VPAYKVASADLTNLPLLDHLSRKSRPLILSTGMSRMDEVEFTVNFLKERGVEFALLHCNSTYPTAFEDVNLRFIFERIFSVESGAGYPPHRRESQQASRQTLTRLSGMTHRSMAEILETLPDEIVCPALEYPGIRQLIDVASLEDSPLKAALLQRMPWSPIVHR